ncbi:MAG: hypothetical protein LBB56_02335 [Chitinispirillales bacterium]|jgi:flagellar biosynthesis/type III secretory pathway protein FliH|nr:hypothetical protein [Chitinispirillales bacterium]
MLLTEWKFEDALRVRKQEGIEEGIEKGREEGEKKGREETLKKLAELAEQGIVPPELVKILKEELRK